MAANILLVIPRSLVRKYQCYGRTFCAHLQGRRSDVTSCTLVDKYQSFRRTC
jgi:hypothetical protein